MSVRKFRLVISQQARADLRNILAFTERRWGRDQRTAYRQVLFEGFDRICTHPEIGVMRADYDPSARSFLIGDHIVVYKIRGETIIVSRVFHPRQDINRIAIDQK